jgi:hypothetical protein
MATIYRDTLGTSAFTKDDALVMTLNAPTVAWSFRIKDLEEWLTTLEETMLREENMVNRLVMERLYFSLKGAHAKHKQQHNEIQTEAPSEADLMAYLEAYAAAINSEPYQP